MTGRRKEVTRNERSTKQQGNEINSKECTMRGQEKKWKEHDKKMEGRERSMKGQSNPMKAN